jgi:inosine/xanthosine triphosphatase
MNVCVGSGNRSKVVAVQQAFSRFFDDVNVKSIIVKSGVHEQPFGFEEITEGAKNRAKAAFQNCNFSVGVEAGFFDFFGTHFNVTIAVVYDGERFQIGLGPAFDAPAHFTQQVVTERKSFGSIVNQASGDPQNDKTVEGAIGFLTNNKIRRSEINVSAVCMALVPFLKRDLYEK